MHRFKHLRHHLSYKIVSMVLDVILTSARHGSSPWGQMGVAWTMNHLYKIIGMKLFWFSGDELRKLSCREASTVRLKWVETGWNYFLNVCWKLRNLRSLVFIPLLPDLSHIWSFLHISDTSDLLCSIFYQENVKMEIQENKSPEVGDNWLDNIRKVGFDCIVMKSKCRQ